MDSFSLSPNKKVLEENVSQVIVKQEKGDCPTMKQEVEENASRVIVESMKTLISSNYITYV